MWRWEEGIESRGGEWVGCVVKLSVLGEVGLNSEWECVDLD